jgi:phosphosulfolactate synthase (CoM biosynthesis protein A)
MYRLLSKQDNILPEVMKFMYENTFAFAFSNNVIRVSERYVDALKKEFGETIKLKKIKLTKPFKIK